MLRLLAGEFSVLSGDFLHRRIRGVLAIGVQHSRHNAVAVIDGLNPLRKVVVLFDVSSLKRSAVFLQASNEVLAERAPGRSVNGHVFGGLWSLHISHT